MQNSGYAFIADLKNKISAMYLSKFQELKIGVGRLMMEKMLLKYKDFHQKNLVAEHQALEFYESIGFV
ncbi:GNAT family N-acetyltransferase [Acinetobacter terrae]|uniref:GNAT family N-acetyltransferase n=1 Tax=Acinetobacter terrae TaxID=2731247 RepID=A0ABX1UZX0_9GAMM|nr:GNAT family N-acetyltransferase [Acinetobacter terrae]NNH86896.1 GNAT family N-acetyltransferase [Acinetobacter terrae]